ncbi:MAG: hypothetical protein RJB38_814 [Pseudomonadota bacterium]|jgi:serine protease Do
MPTFLVLPLIALIIETLGAPWALCAGKEVPSPAPRPVDISAIAKRAIPAVVSIQSLRNPGAAEQRSLGIGSGVVIRDDGLIVTSNHVIHGATKLTVSLHGHPTPYQAKILATDSRTDIALLKLESPPTPLASLKLANSDVVRVGDPAIAVGNPFGFNSSVTAGIISARGRSGSAMTPLGEPGPDVEDMMQTDAAINPGNSGGPLLNSDGEMIGLNAAIYSQNGAFIGIGFAIPSKVIEEVTTQLLKNGRVIRGWIGVTAQDLSPLLASKFKTDSQGALISHVRPESPASLAGLLPGDVIHHFDRQVVNDSLQLKALASQSPSGKTVVIDGLRAGKPLRVQLTIREQPQAPHDSNDPAKALAAIAKTPPRPFKTATDLGLALQNIPNDLRKAMDLGPKNGVLISQVSPGSLAFELGISTGDVLLSIEERPITQAEEANDQIIQWLKSVKKGDALLVLIQREPGDRLYVAIPAPEPAQAKTIPPGLGPEDLTPSGR